MAGRGMRRTNLMLRELEMKEVEREQWRKHWVVFILLQICAYVIFVLAGASANPSMMLGLRLIGTLVAVGAYLPTISRAASKASDPRVGAENRIKVASCVLTIIASLVSVGIFLVEYRVLTGGAPNPGLIRKLVTAVLGITGIAWLTYLVRMVLFFARP